MPTKEFKFVATPEKGEVSALLMRPRGATHLLVLGHGAGADMRSNSMQKIAENLAEQKVATFRYNFPFKEQGRSKVDSPKVATATVRSAVAAAHKLEPKLALIAGGHSFGGRMTTTAQSESARASPCAGAYIRHSAACPRQNRQNETQPARAHVHPP